MAAIAALTEITSWQRQVSPLAKSIGADIEAILSRGGWARTHAGPVGRAARANGKLHNDVVDKSATIFSRESYDQAFETVFAKFAVDPGRVAGSSASSRAMPRPGAPERASRL
jgi:hypothetical protein